MVELEPVQPAVASQLAWHCSHEHGRMLSMSPPGQSMSARCGLYVITGATDASVVVSSAWVAVVRTVAARFEAVEAVEVEVARTRAIG